MKNPLMKIETWHSWRGKRELMGKEKPTVKLLRFRGWIFLAGPDAQISSALASQWNIVDM